MTSRPKQGSRSAARVTAVAALAFTLSMAGVLVATASSRAKTSQSEPTLQETQCTLDGWTNNSFGGDIPVRARPDEASPIIGRLPITADDAQNAHGDRSYSVRMDIVGSLGDWLHIARATDDYNDTQSGSARPVHARRGWVPANGVRFQIQSAHGFDAPSPASRKVVDLGNDWVTDLGTIERVLACDGSWVLIDLRLTYERRSDRLIELPDSDRPLHRAWFRGVCGNEETTCDMPHTGGAD